MSFADWVRSMCEFVANMSFASCLYTIREEGSVCQLFVHIYMDNK